MFLQHRLYLTFKKSMTFHLNKRVPLIQQCHLVEIVQMVLEKISDIFNVFPLISTFGKWQGSIWPNWISFTLELSVPSNIEFGSVAREKVVFFYCHRCIMAFSLIPLKKDITLHLINFKILNQRMFYKGQISLNLIQGFCRRRSLPFSMYFVISLV